MPKTQIALRHFKDILRTFLSPEILPKNVFQMSECIWAFCPNVRSTFAHWPGTPPKCPLDIWQMSTPHRRMSDGHLLNVQFKPLKCHPMVCHTPWHALFAARAALKLPPEPATEPPENSRFSCQAAQDMWKHARWSIVQPGHTDSLKV